MKAFCTVCGAPVPQIHKDGKWSFGKCKRHPDAKRVLQSWFGKQFAAARAVIDALKDADCPGRVYSGGVSYWSVMDSRARRAVR